MKIKKGDNVLIKLGKDSGKAGKVSKSLPKLNKIIISGLNVAKKHSRPTRKNPHGGIIDLHMPVDASNVLIICPRCNKTTRVGYKLTEKSKLRICKKCKETLDK